MKNLDIEKAARELYDSSMPYHNFDHALEVAEAGQHIVDKCRVEGIDIDEEVVYLALLLHDAGYHEDHLALGFESKEAYSADLAEKLLRERSLNEKSISMIKDAILSTHCDAECHSNEDKAVRAADLSGMASDYLSFKDNALKLKREYEMMSGKDVSWEEWRGEAADRIELFLRVEMALTSDYYDNTGHSIFHTKVRENLTRLRNDESASL